MPYVVKQGTTQLSCRNGAHQIIQQSALHHGVKTLVKGGTGHCLGEDDFL